MDVLRFDRQRNAAALAIHAGEPGFHFLAYFEQQARVFHPIARQFGGSQLAIDSVAKIDDCALGVDFAYHAFDDAALRVLRDIGRERILGELLDPQADAFAFRIDRQHHRVDLLCLLIAANRLLTRHIPGDVRQMHQAVDSAGQTDEYAEIGDRFDLAADLVAAVVVVGKFLPWIGLALLHAQADAAALLVDVKHHDLDFLADMHDLGRIDVLVGPVHFGDMHQSFDALFDFHEAAVVRDVGYLAEKPRIRRIAPSNILPGIGAELLQAQ